MKIAWSHKAEKQLNQIFEYIAADSTFYAYRTVQQIILRVEDLARQPWQGRVVPEYEREEIREVFYSPYRIIYLLSDDQVEVLSVIHVLDDDPR